ncbi:CGNR zinc finger domain-containing protein [Actinomycetospora soli]|uniref:CGNR zinc finger domain-containing protein n=1 Tax=Actinomycetospora soli TaxID=2893887 RepID=UPI001E5C4B04|nr:CGNR zinc finger domain-containing protein [Actinomycetospora soli]MCD2188048.1 CGNR zinc finger domain-containing protein [Actinomycetospora soli]
MDRFVGGHPALDFVNTADGTGPVRASEHLPTWDAVLAWCRDAGLVDPAEDVPAPADPASALAALRAFREDLHAFLTAGGRAGAVRAAVVAAHARSRLDPSSGWTVPVAEHGADVPALRITLAVGALLAGPDLARVSRCGRCSWVFLDPSPSRRRRWCSMATCGNRSKQDRLRQRQ